MLRVGLWRLHEGKEVVGLYTVSVGQMSLPTVPVRGRARDTGCIPRASLYWYLYQCVWLYVCRSVTERGGSCFTIGGGGGGG